MSSAMGSATGAPRNIYQYTVGENQSEVYDSEAPNQLICTISSDLMRHPVNVDCEGFHTFEEREIKRWMESHSTCPTCRGGISRLF